MLRYLSRESHLAKGHLSGMVLCMLNLFALNKDPVVEKHKLSILF